jgi:hypothetical protein
MSPGIHYTCEFCEARFRHSDVLKSHIFLHSSRRKGRQTVKRLESGYLEYFPKADAVYRAFHKEEEDL